MASQVEKVSTTVITLDAHIPRFSMKSTHVRSHIVCNLCSKLTLITGPGKSC